MRRLNVVTGLRPSCVNKKNGTVRLCGDYKQTINPCMEIDRYALPRPEELIQKLAGGTQFTTLDLSQAYQQMRLNDHSQPYTTVTQWPLPVHQATLRYCMCSCKISKRLWNKTLVLHGLEGVGVYNDDLLVTGDTIEAHLNNLENVLTRLQEHGLKLQQGKCRFFQPSVEFLGQCIDAQEVHVNPTKVECIKKCPQPETVYQLQSFSGMVQYHNRFIPHLSTLLHPLTRLLQKWFVGIGQLSVNRPSQQSNNS